MTPEREKIMDLVLGNLSPAEAAEVERALESDPAMYAEWQADQDALMAMVDDLDLSAVRVPEGAQERLLERLHAEERTPNLPFPVAPPAPQVAPRTGIPAWALALLAVAAVSLVAFWMRPDPDALNRYARVPGAVSQTVTVAGQAPAHLVQLPDGRVFIRMAQAVPEGKTYQLWELRGATPVSLGVFDREFLSASLPRSGQVAVSVEPPGGSPQPTTEPLFLQGL